MGDELVPVHVLQFVRGRVEPEAGQGHLHVGAQQRSPRAAGGRGKDLRLPRSRSAVGREERGGIDHRSEAAWKGNQTIPDGGRKQCQIFLCHCIRIDQR